MTQLKLLSWNVNGLRAVLKKDFEAFLQNEAPDFLGLQEIKATPEQVTGFQPEGYHIYWNPAEKKGYSGTMAIIKKSTLGEPLSVEYGIGKAEHDTEGRVITTEFSDFFIITVYTPNSGEGLKRLEYRKTWDKEFLAFLKKKEKKKPIIVCGDLNVAHQEIDLKNPDKNHENAGFTDQEREDFGRILKAGFIDSFRHLYPDATEQYTWWTYRFNARSRNAGWRIDYFVISPELQERLEEALILDEVHGSDHCPVGVLLQ